jgi:signal transduction histidine kinase
MWAAVGGIVVAAAAVVLTWELRPLPGLQWLLVHADGVCFTMSGVVLWLNRPGKNTGPLMIALGMAWYIGDLQLSRYAFTAAIGFCFLYTANSVLAHLALSLPSGRLTGLAARATVLARYVLDPVIQGLRLLHQKPSQAEFWDSGEWMSSVWIDVGQAVVFLLQLATIAQVVHRWRTASRPTRRAYGLAWSIVTAIQATCAIHMVTTVWTRASGSPVIGSYFLWGYAIIMALTPVVIALSLMRVRLARLAVASLVRELATPMDPSRLRDAVATALADDSLEFWFRSPGSEQYVDAAGKPVSCPQTRGRTVRTVPDTGGGLAILVHDSALEEQPALVEAVIAAARLAMDNARLHATHRVQIQALRVSRERIVLAADGERRKIQRDLHDGVQHKLLAIAIMMARAREHLPGQPTSLPFRMLATASTAMQEAIRELRDLTVGIYPAALAEQGLAAAVEQLTEQAPLAVRYDIPQQRWPQHIEQVAYFVTAEALANTYKHAHAGQVDIHVIPTAEHLTLRVTDNGIGTDDLHLGNGLRGIHDRVGALGGTARVSSAAGVGTTIVAELPWTS